jgi:Protein of unknown function (DUF3592)
MKRIAYRLFENLQSTIFSLSGICVLFGTLFWLGTTVQFLKASLPASGKVISVQRGSSHPTIDFRTDSGVNVNYTQGGLIFGYSIGDSVNLRYDPDNPRKAEIDSFGALWAPPLLCLLLGLSFIAAGYSTGNDSRNST